MIIFHKDLSSKASKPPRVGNLGQGGDIEEVSLTQRQDDTTASHHNQRRLTRATDKLTF